MPRRSWRSTTRPVVWAQRGYWGVSQDWRRWATEGLVDTVYPMFYGDARSTHDTGAYVRTTLADLDRRAASVGGHRAMLALGIETAPYAVLTPDDAETAIASAMTNGADGVALEMLPYWWLADYQDFRTFYAPRSDRWPMLWDYDSMLRRALHYAYCEPPANGSSNEKKPINVKEFA